MATFKVGDKVRVVLPNDYRCAGEEGVVSNVHLPWSPVVTFLSEDVDGDTELGFANSELELVEDDSPDAVEHPSHYYAGMPDGVQVIDVIRSQGGSWEFSNAVKYLLRARHKGAYIQDLQKCVRYLTWEIDNTMEGTS